MRVTDEELDNLADYGRSDMPARELKALDATLAELNALRKVADEAAMWRDERELEGANKSTWHRLLDALKEAGR